jgi:hypothetical protein
MRNFNGFAGVMLRYVANPLGIKSYSVSYDSMKKYRVERRIYRYSSAKKVVSIIGHTHRPLFESLSKIDSLKFRIEQLCRDYLNSTNSSRESLQEDITLHKRELEDLYEKNGRNGARSSLYNSRLLIPCIFNSGCGIGKRGITAIEIEEENISLVHWFDSNRSAKYFSFHEYDPERLEESDYFRVVLKTDHLDYIFTRIRLLS